MSLLVVGLGNPDRGDDSAGHLAVSRATVGERILRRDCADLIDLIESRRDVIIVDAMQSGAPPGTIKHFVLPGDRLPNGRFVSSHFFGLSETLRLADTLGQLPKTVTVFGIEAADTTLGGQISPEVAEAAEQVSSSIDKMGSV